MSMKIELNTSICPIVIPDTYGTGFQYEPIEDWIAFKELMVSKAKDYIEEALDEIDFPYTELKMGKFNSPREYNFYTDWIDFSIEVPDDYISYIRNNVREYEGKEFFDYIENRFGSCSGFFSSYPYTVEDFYNRKGKDEYILSMWIMYQMEREYDMDIQKYRHEYLDDVWEYASGNGYVGYEEDEYE